MRVALEVYGVPFPAALGCNWMHNGFGATTSMRAASRPTQRRYDRDWKKIGDYVGSKTVIQVRFRRFSSTCRSLHPPNAISRGLPPALRC